MIENSSNYIKHKKSIYLFAGIALFFWMLMLSAFYFGLSSNKLAVLFLLPIISVFLFNFKELFNLQILLVFIYFTISSLQIAVLFTFLLLISFIITNKRFSKDDFSSEINLPILIFTLVVFISLFQSINLSKSLIKSLNFMSFIILFFVAQQKFVTVKSISKLFYVYFLALFVSTLTVLFQAFTTGDRVFGISEVFYVDLVGIGAIFSLVMVLFSAGKKKYLFSFLLLFYILGLIVTQTRNSWISFLITFLSIMIYLFRKSEIVNISKRKIVKIFYIFLVSIVLVYFSAGVFSSGLEKRVEAVSQETYVTDDPESLIGNSLVTRILIWHTAYNAFVENPVLGIGMYSFPFSSQLYYKMPKPFYKYFVEGLTPHQGYLGVLAETGIIGFIAFIFLISRLLLLNFKNIKFVKSKEEAKVVFLVLGGLIYITISLMMTHAWLWGQQVIVFGILSGLSVSVNKIVSKNE